MIITTKEMTALDKLHIAGSALLDVARSKRSPAYANKVLNEALREVDSLPVIREGVFREVVLRKVQFGRPLDSAEERALTVLEKTEEVGGFSSRIITGVGKDIRPQAFRGSSYLLIEPGSGGSGDGGLRMLNNRLVASGHRTDLRLSDSVSCTPSKLRVDLGS